MLTLNLKPIFQARGIERPYSFLVKSGFSYHTANLLLNSTTKSFRLDHIEKLCTILICEPNDLLLYSHYKDQQLPQEHPLNNLKQTENQKGIQQTLATMPYKQLKQITTQINNQTTPEE
jgi:DNA-binding Xre family transcriptional regulator